MLQLDIITFFHMPRKNDEIIFTSLMVCKLIHYLRLSPYKKTRKQPVSGTQQDVDLRKKHSLYLHKLNM